MNNGPSTLKTFLWFTVLLGKTGGLLALSQLQLYMITLGNPFRDNGEFAAITFRRLTAIDLLDNKFRPTVSVRESHDRKD